MWPAEPGGYVRIVVDERPPMASLLRTAVKQGSRRPIYVGSWRLLAGPRRAPFDHGLIEPLSERELDVLRLLRSDLSGPKIARELVVSVNTVRTHTKAVYVKLGISNVGLR
jgi:LuxR family maltose regulon positive regulatory protein